MAIQDVLENPVLSVVLTALLTDHDLARLTGFSVQTVRKWRLLGLGPRFLKISGICRYRPEDVAAWLESRPTGGEIAVQSEAVTQAAGEMDMRSACA
jgi:hypothetical protein